jgi:hypothetical protein
MSSNCDLSINYSTALELHKAIVARIVDCVVNNQKDVTSPEVQSLYEVKDTLDDYIDSCVLAYEANVASTEASVLDDEESIAEFLKKLDRDDT